MQPTPGYPSEDNQFHRGHVERMLASWRHWTGRDLVDPELPKVEQARQLFHAPFAVLSHDAAPDPLLNYSNQAGLDLFELSWDELLQTPSRLTTEPIHRDARAELLAAVSRQGYIDNYRGVRISKTGRRFLIEQATVWNLLDDIGTHYGQAATFGAWKFFAPTEPI
jgi:hypothetical protein